MPTITLNFSGVVQSSVQINDIAYYVDTSQLGGFDTGNSSNIVRIGSVISVGVNNIVCNIDSSTAPPSTSDFIMFSKDNKVNLSSLVGYYSTIKLRNSSKKQAELFTVNSDFSESSK